MRTDQERIRALHCRVAVLARQRDLTRLRAWGGLSILLTACLLAMTAAFCHGHELAGATAAGASLLSDAAGGYVLVGVLAFMAGVIIAAVILKKRHREELSPGDSKQKMT